MMNGERPLFGLRFGRPGAARDYRHIFHGGCKVGAGPPV
jgi:hypothetical protein